MNQVPLWFRRAATALCAKVPARSIIVLSAMVVVVILFPFSSTTPLFDLPKEGQIAGETIIAPFTFDVAKMPQELEAERKKASARVLLVADFHPEVTAQTRRKLLELRSKLVTQNAAIDGSPAKTDQSLPIVNKLSETTLRTLKKYPRLVDASIAEALSALDRGILDTKLISAGQDQSGAFQQSVSKNAEHSIAYDKDFVTLRRNRVESTIPYTDIPDKEQSLEIIVRKLRSTSQFDAASLNAAYEMLATSLQPNIYVNDEETVKRKEKAALEVLPIRGKVLKETEVVRAHQVVTADVVEKLYSLKMARMQMDASGELANIRMHNFGGLLLIVVALAFTIFYISRFHKDLIRENKNIMAMACIVVVQITIIRLGILLDSKLLQSIDGAESLVTAYIIPTSMAAVLSAIFFDFRLSFSLTLFVSLFFAAALGSSFPMFLASALSGFVAGFVTKNIRYRFDFFKALPPIASIYAILIFILDLINYKFSAQGLLQNLGLAVINCVFSIITAMVLTMVFEHLFDMVSNMTLIELADMNNPILKRLSIEAAGTYNHSVLVGNLAESAAQRIGANSLFVRVASYYHDIGKIEKAGYFIENMMEHEKKNKHAKLSPNLSALLISSHVKEGVELAKRYKLPGMIRDAILQHHGNSTVSFFYEKALEQYPHHLVQEEQFRYPGPLPQTRENAIIMLADAVEAASRSLATSSPKLLRDLVKKVIRDKFTSAQLDQSNLTLRDLDEIVEGFMPILQGIFHTRTTTIKEKK